MKIGFGIDMSTMEFNDLNSAFFLEEPPKMKIIPKWSLDKVLTLLESPSYDGNSCSLYNLLKKTLFLTALASGNRVSELAAVDTAGFRIDTSRGNIPEEVNMVVSPGFLFKNQRQGRTPPNICIKRLPAGSERICPVTSIETRIRRMNILEGSLFINSVSRCKLKPPTISKVLCTVINEADPGKFPKGHDVRRVATSLAWTRGLRMEEITRRAFWSSSSVFINCYLSHTGGRGNALNTW